MRPYCPACLDVWCIASSRIDRGDFDTIPSGVYLHVSCGRALEAIRTTPATFEFEPAGRAA